MCGDFVSDHSVFNIFFIGQAQMLFGRDVTPHRSAEPADESRSDSAGYMIVCRCRIRDERSEGVEWSFVTYLELPVHVFLDEMQRHVSRAFDHYLAVVVPGLQCKFSQCVQLGK